MEDIDITALEFDSRNVSPGALYFAIQGERFDGHAFVDEAIMKGARAVVAEKELSTHVPYVVVADARIAMGKCAQRFYGTFDDLVTIGITGTNGKTTTAFLLHMVLAEAGMKPGLIGTVCYSIGDKQIPASRTTPESLDVFRMMHKAKQDGARAMVMEVSSHALSLHRVDEITFQVAVFTNLTQDHLDFHGSSEAYKEAKFRLFSLLRKNGCAIINRDDPVSAEIEQLSVPQFVTYGIDRSSTYMARVIEDTLDGLTLDVFWAGNKQRVISPLIGSFNAYNILAAFSAGDVLAIDVPVIVQSIAHLSGVRGRMERVSKNVFVDYAHTPDAIKHALIALRHYCKGKLMVVFGCGGNRDRDKRPKMGAIASEFADQAVVTSDNPRKEDPREIIRDIERGITRDNYVTIGDRREAIAYALHNKQTDDVVLVAGKGHENYQVIGDRRIVFDDAEVIRQCFGNL